MVEKKKVEINLVIGNDNGNSEHDIVIDGIQIAQPNVMSKVRKLPLLDEINPKFVAENIHDNLIVSINSPSVAPGIYYIGNYALKSGERVRNIGVGADNDKLNSDIIVVNTLAQVAGFAVNKAFKLGEDLNSIEIVVKADMTTALPVTQYTKTKGEIFSNKFMKENHNAIVYVGTTPVTVNVTFEFTKTLPEAVPATFALKKMKLISKPNGEELTNEEKENNDNVREMFAELNVINKDKLTEEEKQHNEKVKNINNGEYVDGKFFNKKRILHTGIGEGTTEYPMTIGIEFDPNFIHGSNNGIGHAIDKAIPEFKQEKGLLNYSRQKYSEVIRDRNHRYYTDAMDILDGYIEEESEEILRNIKAEIQRANNEVDILCIYGGGSILMREHLKNKVQEICDKAGIILFYVPAKYAVTLESQGMYQFTKSKIFKALKSAV